MPGMNDCKSDPRKLKGGICCVPPDFFIAKNRDHSNLGLFLYSKVLEAINIYIFSFLSCCSQQAEPAEKPVENGFAEEAAGDGVEAATEGVKELTFEEDEEESFYTKDLPQHACK